MRKIFNTTNLIRFVFATFIISIIFIIIRIILAPAVSPVSDVTTRVKSDYVLMLIQCIVGLIAMMLPGILKHTLQLNIPSVMLIIYSVFLYAAIYLGEVRNFYFLIPYWDTVLHTFSGAALGALGFSLVNLLNKSEPLHLSLTPGFVALFAFCFAVSLGVIWEIYEFAVDFFLHTNAQKYALENGELLIGQEALSDTMKDMIVDVLGAISMSVTGYISLKYKKGWHDRFMVKSKHKSNRK